MKSLISVTPREFKRDFDEAMEMCADCSGMQVGPHRQFNKKILDDLKVKYY